MLLGIVVVIIVGGLLVNYFKSVNKTGITSSDNTEVKIDETVLSPKPSLSELPKDYTVQKGDSLWTIAESVYASGYNWSDIYSANKDVIGTNPSNLEVGIKLTIPKVEPKSMTAVAPVSHTVVKGESLSQISFNVCGNAFLWPSIATDNKIANPSIIEVGQILQVGCR